MRTLSIVAALALCSACGPPVAGTWRSTTSFSGPTGGISTVVFDFEISSAGWTVGGGCVDPLVFNGNVGLSQTANWTCTLKSGTGLPLVNELGYTWQAGDVLKVESARFELLENKKLNMQFAYWVLTDPNNPTAGTQVELNSKAGDGADRVK